MAFETFFQWIATAEDVMNALGETPRPGAELYLVASSQGPAEFWVVEKLRGPGVGAGYERYDSKGRLVQVNQIRSFLENRGETIPTRIRAFIRASAPGGPTDEVVIQDDSRTLFRL